MSLSAKALERLLDQSEFDLVARTRRGLCVAGVTPSSAARASLSRMSGVTRCCDDSDGGGALTNTGPAGARTVTSK